jgi:hypothetical protein
MARSGVNPESVWKKKEARRALSLRRKQQQMLAAREELAFQKTAQWYDTT